MSVKPKKHLGQHFLTDKNIAAKIIDSLGFGTKTILEVGPGKGILSELLFERKGHQVFLIDIDHECIEFLKEAFPEHTGQIIHADFLRWDMNEVRDEKISIIGNFPYNISSQILFRVLEYRNKITEIVGMFQKEVAERIATGPGSKQYGILSVLMQAYYDIDLLFHVNPGVFLPPPKVKSSVIRFRRNNTLHLDCDEGLFHRIVKTAFNQRRKTLRNALKSFQFSHDDFTGNLMQKRAEQLSVEDFVLLARHVV